MKWVSKQKELLMLEQVDYGIFEMKPNIADQNNTKELISITEKPTIMSLPDDILAITLVHLNQIHVFQICTVNRRLYNLAFPKLYNAIYFNPYSDYKIHISGNLYTPFYTKFIVVNNQKTFPWPPDSPNINLVRKMVFRSSDAKSDTLQMLYPWIEFVIEAETISYISRCSEQNYQSTSLILSKRNTIPILNPPTQELPWVKKLKLYMFLVEDQSLSEIAKLCKLTDLEIFFHDPDTLEKLKSIGLEHLSIKALSISIFQSVKKNSVTKIKEIFNLEIISSFELRLSTLEEYPDSFQDELVELFTNFKNIHSVSLIFQDIDFDQVFE